MAALRRTVVATGVSSGLGFEAIRQLLGQSQPYRLIIGARNTPGAQAAFNDLQYDRDAHALDVLHLDNADLSTVKTFAQQTLEKLGQDKLDILFLNAAIAKSALENPGYKWCEGAIVNHFSHHYLTHLLREKLVTSKARIVQVSSGAIRSVPDPSVLDSHLRAGAGGEILHVYAETKFLQFLGAHWWRRQLKGQCDVVAVSPGMIPNTGLGREGISIPDNLPDAKSVPEGAKSMLAAFDRSDFPEDPDRIFLTSWGEWWESDVYKQSLDKELQDKWCPSLEEIEKREGILAA
ncbi:Protochlorophyllide reductase A, chloroplastic [Paramyrothecium foliicola]|nr:Protochlorophyllide reductase A, chloroplastic [Paramyrothecium foliicola]